jgi:hypothetical protein
MKGRTNNGRLRRDQRREDAEARQGERDSRSDAEQLAKLGFYEAKKERARLEKRIKAL